MKRNDATVFDSEGTVCESEETVLDTERTVNDDATVLDAATIYEGTRGPAQAEEKIVEKGRTLLNTYRIESDAIVGGMGKVWKVHHNSWNVDLAMKQPKATLFQTEKQKGNFIRECEAWINLGLHPHIVSCYYVREVGGIPTVFSEWMDGGSLKDVIENDSLYDENSAGRILDIAIQFARGLHYAHEQGLIHQDVKPDNLMLSRSGEAKVADFGIARARATLTIEKNNKSLNETIFSESGGYTPAYCSMEQINGEKLTRRTDVYSWAVSVMEMYLGERPWQNGVIAGAACEGYFPGARVKIPDGMRSLLKECMNANAARRPHDFSVVEARLLGIYRDVTGSKYPRISPKAAADTADSLNNRALSFIDIGKPDDAAKCWEQALLLDPKHPEAVANYTLNLWRGGAIDDLEALRRMEELNQNKRTWRSEFNIAKVHMERGDTENALGILTGILDESGGNPDVENAIAFASEVDSGWEIVSISKKGAWFKCLSPDGKMAVAQNDDSLIIIDIESGEILQTLPVKLTDRYKPVCFSPDGKNVLLSSPLQIWDIKGNCRYKFGGYAYSVGFSPDGKYILSGEDTTISLWDAESGVCINTLKEHSKMYRNNNQVGAVCWSLDGRFALSGGGDGCLKLWDILTGECVRTFSGHTYEIFSACFSPDGHYALSGGNDQSLRLWDVTTGECLRVFPKGTSYVSYVYYSPDGTWAISSYHYSSMRVWDVKTGKCICTLSISNDNIMAYNNESVSFAPGGRALLFVCGLDCFRINVPSLNYKADWALCKFSTINESLQNETKLKIAMETAEAALARKEVDRAQQALQDIASIPGFSVMPEFRELNFKVGRFCIAKGLIYSGLDAVFPCNIEGATREHSEVLAISPDGTYLLTAAHSVAVSKLWDVKSGQELYVFDHKTIICAARFSPDRRFVLTGSADGIIKLWDSKSGKCCQTFEGQIGRMSSIYFSPDGKHMLSNYAGYETKLWNIKTGECLHVLEGFYNSRFSPDGLHIISDKYLYNMKTEEKNSLFQVEINSKCISPDGRYLIANDMSMSEWILKLYDIHSGQCIQTFEETAGHKLVSISPDGNYLLTCELKTLTLWDIKTRKNLRTFTTDYPITIVQFSPDGGFAIAACNNGTTLFWRLDYEYEFPGWSDWDEDARPYLETFLVLHPDYTDADFNSLIAELQNRGYGYLRPEGVRAKLKEMRPKKKGMLAWFKK